MVKKKERLALEQLKTKKLLGEQELKCKMTELEYEKEFMEAQMEEEREIVGLEVYKQAEENKIDNLERGDNMDILSMELELSTTQRTKLCNLNEGLT